MKTPRRNLYRQLLTTALLVGGTFQIASSVLAQAAPTPTRAGAAIENTATATYTDPNNPGTTLGSSSNKVIITVAEVAGVFVNNAGVVDNTPATGIQSGDLVYFYFDVTNVGNDPTNLVIPNLATVAGPGAVLGDLATSIDGGTTYTAIAAGGSFTSGQIQPGASVRVRVQQFSL
ncbi:MAG: hypothetical protein KME01_15015 [Chroococcus sp. CMT-3BRIN-NPC107]|jgi:hypothetical protein|nr:hypothetical protein [Chroococcus sp. CMT-3BRIN-NPC107]